MTPMAAKDNLAPVRDKILDAALPIVPFDGWSLPVLRRAAREAEIDLPTQLRALPRGVADLLDLFAQRCDDAMAKQLSRRNLKGLKIRLRVTEAVKARIETMTPHKAAAHRGLQTLSSAFYAPLGVRLLARTSDRIWRATGDTSTDVNYYTKRAILSGVYASTVLVYFDDQTPDHVETWEFLDRRIENVMGFEKVKAQVSQGLAKMPSPLAALAGLRYLGRR